MKVKWLKELPPEYDEYDICLSSYFTLPDIEDEECVAVLDKPIANVAINNDTKEIRFIIPDSDQDAIETIENNIKDISENT